MYIMTYTTYYLLVKGIYFMEKKTNKTFYTFCQFDMQSYTWIVIIYYGFASSVPHFIFGKKIVFTSGQTDYQYRVFVRYFILKLASFFTAKFSPVLV